MDTRNRIDEFFESCKNTVFFISKDGCKYCKMLEMELNNMSIPFNKLTLDSQSDSYTDSIEYLKKKTDCKTFPMLYIGEQFVGGYSDFMQKRLSNEIEEMLNVINIKVESDF